ncbi:peptidylprolyl isomerase [Noviherbaspirillum malthae]|jgi:peptidyl-prolyl cis-trans isomerase SurA|uniref:peptidylprolyl isomerase n=1 Tax=Noviherbaspirillum malthae TaxID=1260987 RepID=UPI0018900236|nr:peptidylprolyl isomerase [Noviherbaspirillum malthae]
MKTLPTLRVAKNPVRSIALAAALVCGAGLLPQAHAQFKVAPPGGMTAPAPAPAAQTQSAPRIYLADAIIAVVNNEVITRQELVERLRQVEQRMRNQNIALPPQPEFQRQMLERMIVDRAQLQLAKEVGIRVDDTMLDRAIARIAEQNKMSLTQFRAELEKGGTPYARFREDIREDIIMQRLREREVDNKIQISESEVDNYLAAEQSAAASQKEYNVSHILVRIPENATPEQSAERRRRAEEVLRQVQGGGDFAKLAATYSDATDALTGGDLGWRGPERLPQLFVDALSSMKQGEVSQLLKSNTGFHIVKLTAERTPSVMKGGAAAAASVQQTHVRHILIKTNQIVTPSEARRKLTELKQRLDNKAATFEELAKLFSNDLSASRGGDLGWIYPGDTVPEFERAMDALKPGEVSEPVESPFGYHLIQVVERKKDDVSKERQRLIARQAIRERKLEEATQDWLRQLRDRAYVEYRFDNADSRS